MTPPLPRLRPTAFATAWALLAITPPLAAQAPPDIVTGAPSPLITLADEVEAFREGEPRSMAPLLRAPDSLRSRWRATLEAVWPDPSLPEHESLTGALLLELLDQADAMEACPEGPRSEPEPVGAECYVGWIRVFTSLPLTPQEVYDIGVEMRLELEDQLRPLVREHLGVETSVEARDVLTNSPEYRFPSREVMRNESAEFLTRARDAMHTIVMEVPDDSLELVVVPEEQAQNIAAAAYYNPPREGRPGRFFLNTLQADSRPRSSAATAAFHEGWPGHHFQFARHADLPPRHRGVRGVFSTPFVEGWGLYSELLADEMGLYPTPADRIGYMLHMQDAIVALQVDAGLHAFGWSREQAIDTMMLVGGRPRGQAEQYADRHLGAPAQTISYMMGHREIMNLREQARSVLGDRFDVREFHEALLTPGPVPLTHLRRTMARWLSDVSFEPCPSARGEASCGTVVVPEDHGDPGSRTIGLNVKVLPGTGTDDTAPVFYLAGGPGQAASDLEEIVVGRFGDALADRDFVIVDQRGTGGSNPLACDTGAPDDPTRFFGPHYTEEELARCLDELAPRADVRLYTTEQFAHDLDAVAEARGYDRIDVVGGSYGTKAALVFMREHPDRIRSAVLEGVAPPSFLNPLPHARGSQEVIDRIFAACADDEACDRAFPDLAERFPALLTRLEDDPPAVNVPGSAVTVPLPREALSYITHLLLFNQQSSTLVPALIDQVDRGQYGLLTAIFQQVVDGLVSGIYFGLQLSVTCTENVPRFADVDLDEATAGTYLRRDMVDGVIEECTRWPAGTVSDGFWDPISSDIPTLLLTGGMDPATPPGFGDEVARTLPNGRLFRVEEGAHITSHPCVNEMVAVFLRDGHAENVEADCLTTIRRPPFQLPAG